MECSGLSAVSLRGRDGGFLMPVGLYEGVKDCVRIYTIQLHTPTYKTHLQAKKISSIQNKLKDNKAMITQADNCNTIIILPTHQYETKIQNFILNNNFPTAITDPNNTFQTQIEQTLKESTTLIPKGSRWKYKNMNPSAPPLMD